MKTTLSTLAITLVLLSSAIAFGQAAGRCVPTDPTQDFLAAVCNLNQTPDRCLGVCSWRAGYCGPLDPTETYLAPVCNLNQTPDRCLGVCTWYNP